MKAKKDVNKYHLMIKQNLRRAFRKIITTPLLLFFCMSGSFAENSYSQDSKFTLHLNTTIKEVCKEMEKESEFKFIFAGNTTEIVENKTVSVNQDSKSIEEILDLILSETDLSYTILKNQVVIYRENQDNISEPSKEVSESVMQQPRRVIKGKVVDNNKEELPGVGIVIEGTRTGVSTDVDGTFQISVKTGDKLVFTFLGMVSQTIEIKEQTFLEVTLNPEARELEEVTIVAFGTQTKASISSSIVSVSTEVITQSPVSNIANALSGRLPGLTTMQQGGQPGDDAAVLYIRGQSSLTSNTPLYVIDGVERSASLFIAMDPSEIESVTILKDAAATAVYGSKAANGVVLITSKRGLEGKTSISINTSLTMQQFTRFPNYLDSYESLKLFNEAMMNDGNDPVYSEEELEHYRIQDDPYRYPNTDWYGEMMRKVAPQYNASINIRGGSKTVRYFVAASYMKQEGQLKTTPTRMYNPEFSYKRYRISSNIDAMITKDFTLSLELAGNLNSTQEPTSHLIIFHRLNRMPPWAMPIINPDGSYAGTSEYQSSNPAHMLNTQGSNTRIRHNLTTAVKMDYNLRKLLKGLTLTLRGAFDFQYGTGKYWTETQSTYKLISRQGRADRYTSFLKPDFFSPSTKRGEISTKRLDGLASLNYKETFGDHRVALMTIANVVNYVSSIAIPYNSVNFIGRANYSYLNKYHVEFNASYRGSENFAPGRRFGFFPSVSASWNVHEENFMKKVSFIDRLKFRASYGMTGNDYASTRFLYKEGKWLTYPTGGAYFGHKGGSQRGYSTEPSIADPFATWERAQQINLGLDLALWKNRLSLTVDRYFEKRDGILQQPRSIPSVIGIGLPIMNIGKTENQGWEVDLAYMDKISQNFSYYIKANGSLNDNKVIFIDEAEGIEWWRKEEGKPLFQKFGYVVLGFFQSQEDIDNSPVQLVGTAPIPGDLKYLDFNGDGVVNEVDQVPIGYPEVPRITYGFSFGCNLHGFNLNVHFQGAMRSSVIIGHYLMYEFYNRGKVQDIHLGRWTPQTAETATYPALHIGGQSQNHVYNTFFLKDNSYLRLKTVELSYNLQNKKFLSKVGIQGVRFYLSGLNLLTWDNLKVVDPETPSEASSRLYPQARNYSVGVNIQF